MIFFVVVYTNNLHIHNIVLQNNLPLYKNFQIYIVIVMSLKITFNYQSDEGMN